MAYSQVSDSLPRIRFATLDDYVRDILAREWDAHVNDKVQLERGFCLGWQLDFFGNELAYRITEIARPDSVTARPSGITFTCRGKFRRMAMLHVHPYSSCLTETGPCFEAGVYAGQCMASDQDVAYLEYTGDPFAAVQCDRRAILFYFPPLSIPQPLRVP